MDEGIDRRSDRRKYQHASRSHEHRRVYPGVARAGEGSGVPEDVVALRVRERWEAAGACPHAGGGARRRPAGLSRAEGHAVHAAVAPSGPFGPRRRSFPAVTMANDRPPSVERAAPAEQREIAVEIKELFGLPAHPLVVHAAVVLLPLAAVATLVCAAIPRARRVYAPVALGLALMATLAVGLAQGSGEELEDQVDETELVEEHTEQGERVLPWAIAVTVAAAAVTAIPLLSRRRRRLGAGTVTAAVVVISLVAGLGATWTVVDVGHSGAKATWNDVGGDDDG
jgi:hypothetical protein